MFCVAVIGYFATFKTLKGHLVEYGMPMSDLAYRFFDMVTVAVPPVLPIAITIASIYS